MKKGRKGFFHYFVVERAQEEGGGDFFPLGGKRKGGEGSPFHLQEGGEGVGGEGGRAFL